MLVEGPASLRNRAIGRMNAGRVREAIAAYRQLTAGGAATPDDWYNLGYLLRVERRFEEALDAYGEAIARGVGRPEEVHLNRAAILSEHSNQHDAAQQELKRALALNPAFIMAWLNLGNLHEDRGDAAAAREAYERVIALDPHNGRANARLGTLDVFGGAPDKGVRRLQPLVTAPQVPMAARAEMGFALGQALDAAGRYDEAFHAFARANELTESGKRPGERYDAAAADRLFAAIKASFPSPAKAADQPGSEKLIFICGMFRSGSTLVETVLGRHEAVTSGGELEIIPAFAATALQPYPQAAADLSPAAIAQLRDAYLAEVRRLHPGFRCLTDKRPDNFLHVGLIKTLFPDARIVNTVREPLDNILSVYFLNADESVSYKTRLEAIVHWYAQYRGLVAHWKRLYPDDIFDLNYDALVAEPEPVVRSLLAFCGLEWDPACLAPERATELVRTASVWQVRQPLHRRSSQRHLNYASHLRAIEAQLRDQLEGVEGA